MTGLGRFAFFFLLAGMAALGRSFAYLGLPGTQLYITEICMAVTLVTYALAYLTFPTFRVVLYKPLHVLIVVFLFYGTIQMMVGWADYQLEAIRQGAVVYYSLFAILVSIVLTSLADIELFLKVLVGFSSWNILATVAGLIQGSFVDAGQGGTRVANTSAAPYYLSAWIVVVALIAFEGRFRKLWVAILGSLFALVIFFGAARSSVLAAAAGLAPILVFSIGRARMRVIQVVVVALIVSGTLVLAIPNARDFASGTLHRYSFTFSTSEGNAAERLRLWNLGLRVIGDHPWFGIGLGTPYAALFSSHWGDRYSTHNGFIAVGARLGLVGLGLLLTILLVFYSHSIRAILHMKTGRLRTYAIALLGAQAANVVLVFFNVFLEGPFGALIFWALIGAELRILMLAQIQTASSVIGPPVERPGIGPFAPKLRSGGPSIT